MTDTKIPTEDLSGMPVADAIRTVMQRAIESGIPVAEVVDDAFGAVIDRAIKADGIVTTAGRLVSVANTLAGMVPPEGQPTN